MDEKKKPPIKVFRVENNAKIGPFHANLWTKLWLYGKEVEALWKNTQRRFPGFKQDFPSATTAYYSATLTEKELTNWFGPFYEILDKEGYHVSEYLTDDYILGQSGKQVAFKLDSAKLVGKRKLF